MKAIQFIFGLMLAFNSFSKANISKKEITVDYGKTIDEIIAGNSHFMEDLTDISSADFYTKPVTKKIPVVVHIFHYDKSSVITPATIIADMNAAGLRPVTALELVQFAAQNENFIFDAQCISLAKANTKGEYPMVGAEAIGYMWASTVKIEKTKDTLKIQPTGFYYLAVTK